MRLPVKLAIALALALLPLNAVPVMGAVRLERDVQAEWAYCVNVTDRTFPQYCDPDAVRLDVEERPDTW